LDFKSLINLSQTNLKACVQLSPGENFLKLSSIENFFKFSSIAEHPWSLAQREAPLEILFSANGDRLGSYAAQSFTPFKEKETFSNFLKFYQTSHGYVFVNTNDLSLVRYNANDQIDSRIIHPAMKCPINALLITRATAILNIDLNKFVTFSENEATGVLALWTIVEKEGIYFKSAEFSLPNMNDGQTRFFKLGDNVFLQYFEPSGELVIYNISLEDLNAPKLTLLKEDNLGNAQARAILRSPNSISCASNLFGLYQSEGFYQIGYLTWEKGAFRWVEGYQLSISEKTDPKSADITFSVNPIYVCVHFSVGNGRYQTDVLKSPTSERPLFLLKKVENRSIFFPHGGNLIFSKTSASSLDYEFFFSNHPKILKLIGKKDKIIATHFSLHTREFTLALEAYTPTLGWIDKKCFKLISHSPNQGSNPTNQLLPSSVNLLPPFFPNQSSTSSSSSSSSQSFEQRRADYTEIL